VPRIVIAATAGLIAGLLFIASNVAALHDPTPHAVPVAASGVPAPRLQAALPRGAYKVLPAASGAEARQLIRRREAHGALVVEGGGATVLVATAGGFNAATTIQKALTKAATPLGLPAPRVSDVVPLQPGDPVGLSLQQVVLGTIMGGFLAGVLSAQLALSEPLRVRVPVRMAFGVAFGGLAAVLVGPVLGVLTGAFLWTWLWLAVAAWVISAIVAALADVAGQLGLLIAFLLLLVLGNPSAGGNGPTEFLPWLHRTVGPYLPPNAAASGLLGTAYFDADVTRPALVLAAWGGLALLTMIVWERRRGRRPPLAYAAAGAAADG
jgi:hypothetical protein